MDPRTRSQQITLPVVNVFLSIEEQILINVAKRLIRHKNLMDDDIRSWQLLKLEELGSLTQENIITIAKHSGLAIDEVSRMLERAGYEAVKNVDRDISVVEAVRRGILIKPSDPAANSAMNQILASYQRQAKDTFNLVNTTLLDQSRQAYIDILNQTVGKVLTGNITPHQALREVIRKWANQGIPALIDRAGRRWSTESYVSMVTRTIGNRVANEMQESRMDEYGVDLIEVSSHSGARPLCAPFQGRIFSRSGTHPKYPPFSTTSYGLPAGLFGINCGHVQYAYVEGVSVQRYHPYDEEENRRVYEESQKQRYLERRIRQAKRERSMMDAIGDKEGVRRANERIRERQAMMRGFIRDTGRTRRYNREQIYS